MASTTSRAEGVVLAALPLALAGTHALEQARMSAKLALHQSQTARLQSRSLRARDGSQRRTFTLRGDSISGRTLAGLHEAGNWQIDVLAAAESGASAQYRMAGSGMPKAILKALEERIAGEPLDAAAERRAREHDWRP